MSTRIQHIQQAFSTHSTRIQHIQQKQSWLSKCSGHLNKSQVYDITSGMFTSEEFDIYKDYGFSCQLFDYLDIITEHYGANMYIEFVVEDGEVYILKTRKLKR